MCLIYNSNIIVFINFRYSLQNCLFAATYDKILEECKCVPYFHTIAYNDYPVICAGEGLYCMNNVLRDIGSHTQITNYKAPEESQAANYTGDAGNIIVASNLRLCLKEPNLNFQFIISIISPKPTQILSNG